MPHADIEEGRECRRKYQKTPAGKAAHLAANKNYRQRNKKKLAAHNAIAKAILRGKMLPMPCIVCGESAEAHHPDYDQPLDVIWLCQPHHREVHAMAKNHGS
jgi:hypothetical protein